MSTMVDQKNLNPPQTGLLRLPNEILIEIAAYLSATSDLWRLGSVNRRLRSFIGDYISRYRYRHGLVALPDELILGIGRYLGYVGLDFWACRTSRHLRCLAQASQRFYPLVMDCVVRRNVRYGGSGLLDYAAENDLKVLARRTLHLGGDINTRRGTELTFRSWAHLMLPPFDNERCRRATPLGTAALCGHKGMVRMLLEAGASEFISGMRLPLAIAIANRHETIAMILSRNLDSDDVSPNYRRSWSTLFQMACEAKLVKVVRQFLELPSRNPWDIGVHVLNDRSIALCRILQVDASQDDFVKRELHDDVLDIASMLLKHGANPDFRCRSKPSNPQNHWRLRDGTHRKSNYRVSARTIAPGHPDPRVRYLVSKAKAATEPESDWRRIGRPYTGSSPGASLFLEPCSKVLPSEGIRPAPEHRQTNDARCTMNASATTDSSKGATQKLDGEPKHTERFPTSSLPQHGVAGPSAQYSPKEFWAKRPF